jgi:cytochrome c-type biogenesis protein
MSVSALISSGPLLLALPVAAAAGAVTFLSPCCLPLVPGFLSYITGMTGAGAATATPSTPAAGSAPAAAAAAGAATAAATGAATAVAAGAVGTTGAAGATATALATAAPVTTGPSQPPRSRVIAATALFVLGFSLVFAVEGLLIGGLGHLVIGHARELMRVFGVITILLGLLFAGAFDRFSFAGRIIRPSARPKAGLAGAPLLGVMFGLGWTPCTGPTLGAVMGLALSTGTAARGAVLAFVYALGLGIPFLLVALGFQRAMRAFAFFRRHAHLITMIGGGLLVCVGLLEVTGAWSTFVAWLQVHWTGYQAPF